ncbi:MAG: FAD-dependent oxidoreductase [Candidatus Nitrosocaldus sp.]
MYKTMYRARILGKRYITKTRDAIEVRLTNCLNNYKPGQYIKVHIDCSDPKRFREMNITSIPDDEYISFAFKVSDSIWKRSMLMLKPMDEVGVSGPYGVFTLPDRPSRIYMIALGIGITPSISMLRYSIKNSIHDIALLYINNDRDSAPYIDELESLVCRDFRLFELFSYSHKDIGKWIKDMKSSCNYNYNDMLDYWYVSGEPTNVRVIKQMLLRFGVQVSRIKIEEFTGY